MTGAELAYWPCGHCRAEHGEPCRTPAGVWSRAHADRAESVRLWHRYGQGGRV